MWKVVQFEKEGEPFIVYSTNTETIYIYICLVKRLLTLSAQNFLRKSLYASRCAAARQPSMLRVVLSMCQELLQRCHPAPGVSRMGSGSV